MVRARILGAAIACALFAPAAHALTLDKAGGGLEFHGFVQSSWLGNYTSAQNEFRVDEVQLDVSREWAGAASFLLRINYRHVDNFDFQNKFTSLDYNKFIEQAWMSIDLLKKSHGLTFAFGKMALPIGVESPNINEMFVYSRSFTLEVGRPTFGTGAMVRWQRSLTSGFGIDIAAYAVNGWDTIADNNDAKTFGGRLGFALFGGDLLFGFSYIAGPEPIPGRTRPNVALNRQVFDFDLLFTGIRRLTIGAEISYGFEEGASQVDPTKRARWLSALGILHYKLTRWFGASLRFEHFDDPDASRLVNMSTQWIGTPSPTAIAGVPQTIESLTLAGLFTLSEGAHVVVEWRNDWSARDVDRGIFPTSDGGFTKSRHLFATSFYYVW